VPIDVSFTVSAATGHRFPTAVTRLRDPAIFLSGVLVGELITIAKGKH